MNARRTLALIWLTVTLPQLAAAAPLWVERGRDDERWPPARFRVGVGAAPLQNDRGAAVAAAEDRARAALARGIEVTVDARTDTTLDELRRYDGDERSSVGRETLSDRVRSSARAKQLGVELAEQWLDDDTATAWAIVVLDLDALARHARDDLQPQREAAAHIVEHSAPQHALGDALSDLAQILNAWPPLPERLVLLAQVAPDRAAPLIAELPRREDALAAIRRRLGDVSMTIRTTAVPQRGQPLKLTVQHNVAGLRIEWLGSPVRAVADHALLNGGDVTLTVPRALPDREGALAIRGVWKDAPPALGEKPVVATARIAVAGPPATVAWTARVEGCGLTSDAVDAALAQCAAAADWMTRAAISDSDGDARWTFAVACEERRERGMAGYGYHVATAQLVATGQSVDDPRLHRANATASGAGTSAAEARQALAQALPAKVCEALNALAVP